jgi:hypothetical protein
LLAIATKVSLDLVLPPNHKVFCVQESKWLRINLAYPVHQTKTELKNVDVLQEYPINGLHYYSETYDLTRPYPSTNAVDDYDNEFCWNDHITHEFNSLGMRKWCCVLLQGIAKENVILDVNTPIHIGMICKRSSFNPGTRYHARGLNHLASPGNEYEVEQLVWKVTQGIVHWSQVIWRRGTVPIHWKSELNSAVADADIVISEKPYEGIDVYYTRLMKRYNNPPVTLLNLLRGRTVHADEANLTEHYEESLNVIKKIMALDVNMIRYDWHHLLKISGINVSVEGLWSLIGPKLKDYGVTVGLMTVSADGKITDSKILKRQQGLVRTNCADSLDRTNLVCFFTSLQTIAEQCKQIGSTLCTNKGSADAISSFESVGFSLDQVKQIFDNDLLVKLAEIYVNKGDVCATVYTNTVAMHTSALREFAQHLPAAPSNTKIIVERRIQNVLKDKHRQTSIEMYLGVNWHTYFPTHTSALSGGRIRYVTPYPSFIFKNLPSEINSNKSEDYSLLRSATKYCWVCPRDYDYVETHIYLPYYCRVTELAITIRHGMSEVSSPSKMDVFVGTHIDDCKMAFQEMIIPRCDDGTKLLYALPPQISGILQDSLLYDFEGRVASSAMRVVRITFYGIPPGAYMTIGQIQVFGVQEESGKTPKRFEFELQQISSKEDITLVLQAFSDAEKQKLEQEKKEAPKHQPITFVTSPSADELTDTNVTTPVDPTEQQNTADIVTADVMTELRTETGPKFSQADSDSESDDEDETDQAPQSQIVTKPKNNTSFDEYFANSDKPTFKSKRDDTLEQFIESSLNINDSTENMDSQNQQSNALADLEQIQSNFIKSKEKYIKFLQTKVARPPVNISFTDALELDLARLKLNLTPSQRDDILVEKGYKVKDFDPNSFVFHRDIEIEKMIRKRKKTNNCHLCRTSIKFKSRTCRYCRLSFCKNCMSKHKASIVEFMWNNAPVCIECSNVISNQRAMSHEIQKHIELEEKKLKNNEDMYYKLLTQMYPSSSLADINMTDNSEHTCLSLFPAAGVLSSVDTDPLSPPIETILMPASILKSQHWYAPIGVSSVPIILIMPCNTEFTKISILVDRLGYSSDDAPVIKVSVADRLPHLKSIGYWDLASKGTVSEDQSNRKFIEPYEKIDLNFLDLLDSNGTPSTAVKMYNNGKNRMLQLTLELPADRNHKGTSFLHLGRVYVYGKVNTTSESTESLSTDDIAKYDQVMRTKQKGTRVQIHAENLFHRDTQTLDTTVSVNPNNKSRLVSGFRICVQHGNAGIGTQVRDIRVSVLSGSDDNDKEVYHQLVGTFVVPKVAPGTNLCFDFDKTYQDIKVVRFEMLSNYKRAEKDISYGSIFIYYNT